MSVAFDNMEVTLVKKVWGYEARGACRGGGGGQVVMAALFRSLSVKRNLEGK